MMGMQEASRGLEIVSDDLKEAHRHVAAADAAFARTNEKITALLEEFGEKVDILLTELREKGFGDLVRNMNFVNKAYEEVERHISEAGMTGDVVSTYARESMEALQRTGNSFLEVTAVLNPQTEVLEKVENQLVLEVPIRLATIQVYGAGGAGPLQNALESIDAANSVITTYKDSLNKES